MVKERSRCHAIERVGIRVLENDAGPLRDGDGANRFWVAGVGDLYTRDVDIAAALSAVPANEPVLLLTHNPDVFPGVPPRSRSPWPGTRMAARSRFR